MIVSVLSRSRRGSSLCPGVRLRVPEEVRPELHYEVVAEALRDASV